MKRSIHAILRAVSWLLGCTAIVVTLAVVCAIVPRGSYSRKMPLTEAIPIWTRYSPTSWNVQPKEAYEILVAGKTITTLVTNEVSSDLKQATMYQLMVVGTGWPAHCFAGAFYSTTAVSTTAPNKTENGGIGALIPTKQGLANPQFMIPITPLWSGLAVDIIFVFTVIVVARCLFCQILMSVRCFKGQCSNCGYIKSAGEHCSECGRRWDQSPILYRALAALMVKSK